MKTRWSLNLALAALGLLLMPSLASGAEPFLIAVASDDVEATSLVSNTAGRSQYYLLFSGTDFVQLLDNPFLARGPGCRPTYGGLPRPKRSRGCSSRKIWSPHDRGHEQKGHEIYSIFGCRPGGG